MKRFLGVAFVLMIVLVVSCGKKEVKRVSEDSKMTTEAFAVVEDIRAAYIKGDTLAIEQKMTREGFRTVSRSIKSFDSAELTFTPVLVEIDGGKVTVNVSWQGTWKKSDKTTTERGMAVFVLKGVPLKVDEVLNSNPFKYPE